MADCDYEIIDYITDEEETWVLECDPRSQKIFHKTGFHSLDELIAGYLKLEKESKARSL